VRQIVPDAFRTTIDGRRVVQAGLFVERGEAEVIQRQLAALDTPTSIFDINYGVAPRSSSASIARDGRTVVVVDPGHGGGDPGAVGIGGIHEADIVLDVAQQVASLLEKQGVQAVLTRQDDREVELEPRVDLADRLNADLFVSIHANSIDLSRPDVNGLETYYYDSGGALATSIHNSVVNATGMPDRGIRQARFYVLTETSMPAVLVEIGFVTGRDDAARFNSATSRSQIAAAIVQGILRYLQ
jgi:N-acetylmuramoyl-L-alanine amidase